MPGIWRGARAYAVVFAGAMLATPVAAQGDGNCPAMRKINIGVSVSPPNVVHTASYIAKSLGLFQKRCIDATVIQFDGGGSVAANTAAAQGTAMVSTTEVPIGRGLKVQQVWGLAPRIPQGYVVPEFVRFARDLKGHRLSATGGGVGSFNWRVGREILHTAGLDVADVSFVSAPTAGRVPGLIAGQVDGVALHPEDILLATRQKPGLHVLVQLADILPDYMFNAYGASTDWIARDRPLLRDAIAALIEANRLIYNDKIRVLPVVMEATQKPRDAVEFAMAELTRRCILSVNEGFDRKRTEWSIENSVANGDLDKAKTPTFEQVVNLGLAREAVELAGGRVKIGDCVD